MLDNQIKTFSGTAEISTFYIGDAVLGINILNIQEINKPFEITDVPLSSDHIEGVMNLRGNIITVLNTGRILGLFCADNTTNTRIIIVESKGEYIGLIVDAIGDVVPADQKDIKPTPSNMDHIKEEYFTGVLENKDQLIGILDADMVMGYQ